MGALDYVDGEAFEAKAVTSGFTWSAVAPVKPYSPEPFAVYSAGDKSLTFYNRAGRPEEGSAFEGKAATKVYADFIGSTYESAAAVPWSNEAAQVAYVSFADEIAPEGSVAYWFAGLTRAVAVDIGENLDTSGCTDFSHMFEGCSNMTLLHVDYLDTAAGTNFGNMFSGCSKLGKIDLSSFDTGKATAMAGMFDGMVMLSEVTLGDAFTFSGIGKNYLCMLPTPGAAFIPDANGLWHTAAGTSYAPGKVPNLKADTYYANAPLVALLYNDGQLVFQRGGAVDQDRELMEGENTWVGFESDPRAGAPWAVRAADVASVRVRDIARPVNCAGWFEGMGNCTSMSLARLDTSMSVSFASMFEGCSSLAGLNVDSFVTSSALSFERMFAGCSSLGVLSLSGFDTSLSQRASGMFDGMDRLKEVTIGDKFSFLAGGYLPAPSDEFIAGADGYWRDIESRPYAPEEVPSGTALGIAATYWAVDEPACAFLYEGGRLVFQRGTEPNLAYGTVAASFDGFETAKPSSAGDVLWNAYRDQVTSVEFENAVFPVSCAYWFSGMPNCTKIDLTLLNTTRAEAMEGMFTDDAIEILAVGANFWLTGKDMGTDAGTVNPAAEFPSPKDGKKNAQWQTVDKPNVKADQVDDCPAKTNKRDATHLVFYSDSDVMAAATRSLLAELEEESEATLSEEPSDLAPGAADAEPPTGIVDEAVDESQERDPEKGEDTPEAAGPEADAGAGEPDVPEEGTSDKDPGSDAGAAAAAAVGAACAVAARKRIRGRHARA